MNKKHIQTFLTVSAAFFAINAPLRANAAQGAAEAIARTTTHATPCSAQVSRSRGTSSANGGGGEQK